MRVRWSRWRRGSGCGGCGSRRCGSVMRFIRTGWIRCWRGWGRWRRVWSTGCRGGRGRGGWPGGWGGGGGGGEGGGGGGGRGGWGGGLEYGVRRVPWACGLTGELVAGCEAGYWVRQAREPVRFADAVAALAAQEISVFVEIGPDGTLSALGPAALGEGGEKPDVVFIPVLRPGVPGPVAVLTALARVQGRGVGVGWGVVLGGGVRVGLPTYAFQRQRYWPVPAPATAGDVSAAGVGVVGHPLRGAAVELAGGSGLVLTGLVSVRSLPWLADHVVGGVVLLPGTAFVEMAVRAGDAAGCGRVEELAVEAPLVLPADGGVQVQVVVGGADRRGLRAVQVYARPAGVGLPGSWTRHASGLLGPVPPGQGAGGGAG